MCQKYLAKFKEDTRRLSYVVARDENLFYWKQHGTKQSNKSWVAEGDKARNGPLQI